MHRRGNYNTCLVCVCVCVCVCVVCVYQGMVTTKVVLTFHNSRWRGHFSSVIVVICMKLWPFNCLGFDHYGHWTCCRVLFVHSQCHGCQNFIQVSPSCIVWWMYTWRENLAMCMRPLRGNSLFPVTRPTHWMACGGCVIYYHTQESMGVAAFAQKSADITALCLLSMSTNAGR